uniref:Putative kolobok-4 hm n=1 Tax=Amblyomma aureolatum TaxID=187763 RepID=A0A1E1X6X9_9ACAR
MPSPEKRSFRDRKYSTKYRFKGRRKAKRRTTFGGSVPDPQPARPNDDSPSDEIDAAFSFVSASEKKIAFFEKDKRPSDHGSANVVCDTGLLTALVNGAPCPTCREHQLGVREPVSKRKGLASFLELHCENVACPVTVLSSTYTSRRVTRSGDTSVEPGFDGGSSRDGFASNVKAVVAARAIGIGYEQLVRFCAIMGLPKPMHHKTFNAITKKVHAAAMSAVVRNLEKAREVTKNEVGGMDTAVMYDGTWQKRGHKSHNGVGTVVSIDTGLCLDFEVLSNYCHGCSRHKELPSEDEIWQAFHGPVCEKNVDCSSHAMEAEAARRIWQRTLSYETPLRFTKFLSDGDSKAYIAVCDAQVYGPLNIEKEDCTNHVAKRLGSALRQLKTPLPRGEKLKESAVTKLQTYYQIAVTSNRGSIQKMYSAIWASYCHSCCSDGASSHKFCPEGTESWCKHRRAEALGQPAPNHTPLLTKAQGKAVLPIYKRLTDEKLLARCIKGKTQNAAESLNSRIWLLCPKTKFASRTVVEMATALAVQWFNEGHTSFERVLEELGVLPGHQLLKLTDSRNERRIKRMSACQTAEARAHRRSMAKRARVEDSSRKDREGLTYSAGQF